ncbi:PDDEXK-like family protein [Massilia arenae]|nr:PD-(D/E)XK nuclease family protein [Massilia arenae]
MDTNSGLDSTLADNLARLVQHERFVSLGQELNRFTPFRVLRVERYELRHTNTLAWLLDPCGSHGMGHSFLDCFLKLVLGADAPLASPLVEVRTELVLNARGALVEDDDPTGEDVNTRDRLDILVEARNSDGRPWVLAIEAKIDSQEGKAQLERYDAALGRLFPEAEVVKCYLTLGPSETVSSQDWQPVYWGEQVGSALREALGRHDGLDQRVRDFLNDYQELINALSGQGVAGPGKAAELANNVDFAPALRVLNKRLKELVAVHSWDAVPWAGIYRQHKAALDACRRAVRERGAILVRDVIDQILDATAWEHLTTSSSKTLRVRFVPRSWAAVDGLNAGEKWNLFYQAEFRKTQGDIEIKLYVAPPGDPTVQKALLQRLFGDTLQLRPADWLEPDPRELRNFVLGSGLSFKLYRQFVDWEEQWDGALSVTQLDQVKKQFTEAVTRHTGALLGLRTFPAV